MILLYEEDKAYQYAVDLDESEAYVKYQGFGDSSSNLDFVMGFYK